MHSLKPPSAFASRKTSASRAPKPASSDPSTRKSAASSSADMFSHAGGYNIVNLLPRYLGNHKKYSFMLGGAHKTTKQLLEEYDRKRKRVGTANSRRAPSSRESSSDKHRKAIVASFAAGSASVLQEDR